MPGDRIRTVGHTGPNDRSDHILELRQSARMVVVRTGDDRRVADSIKIDVVNDLTESGKVKRGC